MINPFSPTLWLGGAALALGIVAGVQTVRLANLKASTAQESAKQAVAAKNAIEALRQEAEEIAERQMEVLNEGIDQYKAIADDAIAARDAGERLRKRAEQLARSAQPSAPASAPSQSASSPADLLALVQRRLDEAADGIAGHADDTYIRSSTCERVYEALRPAK